jgi:hypothetical protein
MPVTLEELKQLILWTVVIGGVGMAVLLTGIQIILSISYGMSIL